MWSFLKRCLDNCINGHDKCRGAQDTTWYPQRLLHMAQDKGGKEVLKLVETKDHPPKSPYMTLSHCWGSKSPFCTTKLNLSMAMECISVSELPKTFQDCVFTGRELGLKYIWIDSLCIIQDDREDWAHHAQCMDKVYENALFTLAAVSSPDGSVPFLGQEAPSNRDNWQAINVDISNSLKFGTDENGPQPAQLKVRRRTAFLQPTLFNGPLEARGWAWQERYLSVRIINFTKQEARWHCKTCQTCECHGVMQITGSDVPEVPEPTEEAEQQPLTRQWRHIVAQYSRRQLTYPTDRLPALSGAASRFQISLQTEYLAGIWLVDLTRSLAWYRSDLSDVSTGKPKMWRSLNNCVPSWSWASISGEVSWLWEYNLKHIPYDGDVPIETRVDLISTSCRPNSNNIFGEVESGSYILLRGMVVEAEMDSDIFGCGCVRREGFGPQHVVPDCHIISATDSSPSFNSNKTVRRAVPTDRLDESFGEGGRSKGPVCCLLLFTTTRNGKSYACILILGEHAGNENTYQRLALGNSDCGRSRWPYCNRKDWAPWEGWEDLEEWEEWERWFEGAAIRTLKII